MQQSYFYRCICLEQSQTPRLHAPRDRPAWVCGCWRCLWARPWRPPRPVGSFPSTTQQLHITAELTPRVATHLPRRRASSLPTLFVHQASHLTSIVSSPWFLARHGPSFFAPSSPIRLLLKIVVKKTWTPNIKSYPRRVEVPNPQQFPTSKVEFGSFWPNTFSVFGLFQAVFFLRNRFDIARCKTTSSGRWCVEGIVLVCNA